MPEMSLSEAASWAGKGRPAILKAIQKGTISARKSEDGQWRIDPAELARVYSPAILGTGSQDVSRSTLDIAEAMASRDREMALLREMLVEARRERDDWKVEASRWHAEAEAQTRLLITHSQEPAPALPQEPPSQPPVVPRAGRLGWFLKRRT